MTTFDRTPTEPLTRAWYALPFLALCVGVFLFEGLFQDRSLLTADNRILPPFVVHAEADGPGGRMNLVTSDINGYVMPETLVQLERFEAGELPLWNDRQNLGQPLLADLGFAPFYPTAILYHVMNPLRAYAWSMALHFLALSAGTYLWLRRRRLTPSSAILGALVIAFGGFLAVRLHIPHFIRAGAWLPWMLLAMERQLELPSIRRIGTLALAVGGAMLAGFPQIAFLGLYAASILAVARPRPPRGLIGFSVGIALGGAISAVHLLPGAEMYQESMRRDLPAPVLSEAKQLEPECLLTFLSPHILGSPVQEVKPGKAWEDTNNFPTSRAWLTPDVQNNFVENLGYIGVVPLVLALASLGVVLRRRWIVAPWLLAIGSVAAAMGAPGLSDLVAHLPGVSSGSPKRLLFVTTIAGGVLAAVTLDEWLRRPSRVLRLAFVVGGVGCGAAAIYLEWFASGHLVADLSSDDRDVFEKITQLDVFRLAVSAALLVFSGLWSRGRGFLSSLLVVACAADLLALGREVNPPQPMKDQFASTPAFEWLEERGAHREWRVMTFAGHEVLGGSIAQTQGVRMANGISAMVDRETGQLLRTLEPTLIDPTDPRLVKALSNPMSLMSPLLDLMGVRYIATGFAGHEILKKAAEDDPAGFERHLTLAYANPAELLAIYERPRALERAFFPKTVRTIADSQERLAALGAPQFAPADVAILEEDRAGLGPELGAGTATLRIESPEVIHIDTTVEDRAALLVLSESHSPGWEVHIDGEPAELLRVDHAFMGVAVPVGKHDVSFYYRPRSIVLGAIVSGAALGLALAFIVLRRRTRAA